MIAERIIPFKFQFVIAAVMGIFWGLQSLLLIAVDPDDKAWAGTCEITGAKVSDGEAVLTANCDSADIVIDDNALVVAYLKNPQPARCTRYVSRTLKHISHQCEFGK